MEGGLGDRLYQDDRKGKAKEHSLHCSRSRHTLQRQHVIMTVDGVQELRRRASRDRGGRTVMTGHDDNRTALGCKTESPDMLLLKDYHHIDDHPGLKD